MADRYDKSEIHELFIEALGERVKSHSRIDKVPFEATLESPLPTAVRVYAFNVTHPTGGRPNGEHKAQLILPDQSRGERASFDTSGNHLVLLLGYVPDSDVFVLWDAGLHRNFAYSKNIQVKAQTIFSAIGGELGTQERRLQTGKETVITSNQDCLADAIIRRVELTEERLLSD